MSLTSNEALIKSLAAAIDLPASRAIPSISLRQPNTAANPLPLDSLDTNELDDHEFLAGEDDTAGVAGIDTIDMMGETIRLFRQTKRLLSRVLVDTKTPVNQKAQVANTLATLLRQLTAQQTEIYNSERMKRLETVIIRLIRDLPAENQASFLADYEREVNELR